MEAAAQDWGISATSSGLQRVAAAMISFGLLDDIGSGKDRRLELTDSATRILTDARPGVKEKLLSEAALRPPVILKYWQAWGRQRPSDPHAISELMFDGGFTETSAKSFLKTFDDALRYIQDDTPGLATPALGKAENYEASAHEGAEKSLSLNEVMAEPALRRDVGPAPGGREVLSFRPRSSALVSVHADGQITSKDLAKLIRLLDIQRQMMAEDEAGQDTQMIEGPPSAQTKATDSRRGRP
ncbi:MAG: hypothetical protein ACU0CO_18220 [Shimia sp.]